MKAVWVFGSHARGDATESSDVDLVVDLDGSTLRGWDVYGMMDEIESAFAHGADVITEAELSREAKCQGQQNFFDAVLRERVNVYGSAA